MYICAQNFIFVQNNSKKIVFLMKNLYFCTETK